MAGEWIPIDCNLGTKPEVLEVAAATHEPIEVVVGRMVRLWSWAWHVTADGTIRVPRSMLATVAGGDEEFWSSVERAGWLESTEGSITIPGWSERFGNAAKRRLLDARAKSVRRLSASCPHDERTDCGLEERRGEENREEIEPAAPVPTSEPAKPSRSRAKSSLSWSADSGWEGITDADRSEWATAFPGAVLAQELAKATAWLKANPQRCGKRNWRRFIVGWLQRCQDKGGTNREPGNRPAGPTPEDRARRRFYRGDAQKSMTDQEYAEWRRGHGSSPEAASLAATLTLQKE
jgi:hypothetical protein